MGEGLGVRLLDARVHEFGAHRGDEGSALLGGRARRRVLTRGNCVDTATVAPGWCDQSAAQTPCGIVRVAGTSVVVASIRCNSCGRRSSVGTEFCSCGLYLPFSGTLIDELPPPAVTRPTPPPTRETVSAAEPVGVVWTEIEPDTATIVEADSARFAARIRTSIVDRFVVTVDGVPPDWVTVEPARFDLLPVSEQVCEIIVRPDEAGLSVEADHSVIVTVAGERGASTSSQVALMVRPMSSLHAVLSPSFAEAAEAASFQLVLSNDGRAKAWARIEPPIEHAEYELRCDPARVVLDPGTICSSEIGVRLLTTAAENETRSVRFGVRITEDDGRSSHVFGSIIQRGYNGSETEGSGGGRYIFLSYSRLDQEYVDELCALLKAHRVPVWVDHDIDYGSRWLSVVRTRVDECTAMVVVMSPSAENSPWVAREIHRAQDRQKVIFPLLFEGSPFFGLNDLQYEDVTSGALPSARFIERLQRISTV
jgi:TIR domain